MTHLILSKNRLFWGDVEFPCSWGKKGITSNKVEGDMATPVGEFPFRQVFYRPDRVQEFETTLPLAPLTPQDGWCDDLEDSLYNEHIKKPYAASHEDLWREDHLYDIILVVGHNDDPVIKGKGSAIFVHLRCPDGGGTAGCIALAQEHLLQVLQDCTPQSCLIVKP